MGRPSDFTEELAEHICNQLMDGLSLRKICDADGMPHRSTVIRWMEARADFATKCARARELQADLMDDMILDEAEKATPETAHVAKVRISAYQWRAAKLQPKKYGEKVQQEHSGTMTFRHEDALDQLE